MTSVMENLATIQRVKDVRNLLNSDMLDIVTILGWNVVTKRGEFVNDGLAVYCCIDSILPETPTFEFLRNKNFRIKPIRLRGQESAGIAFPLSILPEGDYVEGQDVTEIVGVRKFIKPIPPELSGKVVGNFPGFLHMTDEKNLRSYPFALEELYGRPFYITRKEDGGEFGVCSRTLQLEPSETNGFWRMARKYDIEAKLKEYFPDQDVCLQGEVMGPGVNGNQLRLTEMDFRFFNLYNINNRQSYGYHVLMDFATCTKIPMVPVVQVGSAFSYTIEELVSLADKQIYPEGNHAEGIVVRATEPFYSRTLNKDWSGKVINTYYKE